MCSKSNPFRWFCLFSLLLACSSAWAGTGQQQAVPPVRAVLFYAADSPQDGDLFGFFLPGLFDRWGTSLEVAGIDVSQPPGAAVYPVAAAKYGLPEPWDGEPIVLVGDRALVGLMAIAAGLGDDAEGIAAEPGVAHWPALPGMDELLAAGVRDIKARVAVEGVPAVAADSGEFATAESESGDRIANALAVAVIGGMILALVHSLVRLRRGKHGFADVATWALPVALLAGFFVSGYTAYTALADVAPVCGPVGGCGTVQDSIYAKPFGIPLGVIGLFAYVSILIAWLFGRYLSPRGGGWRWLPWVFAFIGVLVSLGLTSLGPFVIGATCIWCLGSAVSMTAALWLLSGETRVIQ